MEEKITNEAIPSGDLRLKADPVFKYENGLEISMIEQESVINEERNNSSDSDCEILKFVFGDENPSTKSS